MFRSLHALSDSLYSYTIRLMILLSIILITTLLSLTASANKLAAIDLNHVIDNSNYAKGILNEVLSLRKRSEAALAILEADIQELRNAIELGRYSGNELQEKNEELALLLQQYQFTRGDLEQKFQERYNESVVQVRKSINEVIATYSKEKEIDIMLFHSPTGAIYAGEEHDITEDVLRYVDEKL